MKKPILNVPSEISHSYFVTAEDKAVYLGHREINYFYLLMFLYREQIKEQTPNLFFKKGKNYCRNEEVSCEPVEIDLQEFRKYGLVWGSQYEDVRAFLDKLKGLSIITNIFGKTNNETSKKIKVLEYCEVEVLNDDDDDDDDDKNKWKVWYTIKFTEDIEKEIVHKKDYFKKVDLEKLFLLRGEKTKILYLLLKDYSKDVDEEGNVDEGKGKSYIGRRDLDLEDIKTLMGTVMSPKRFKGTIDKINDLNDIHVTFTEKGRGKRKVYKCTIKNFVKEKKEEDKEVVEEVEKRIEHQQKLNKKSGKKIINMAGYRRTVTRNVKMEKNYKIRIDKWLGESKETIGYDEENPNLPYLVIDDGGLFPIDEDKGEVYYPIQIDDEYRMIRPLREEPLTDTPKLTIETLNKIMGSGIQPYTTYYVGCRRGNTKSCFLSTEELEKRGKI